MIYKIKCKYCNNEYSYERYLKPELKGWIIIGDIMCPKQECQQKFLHEPSLFEQFFHPDNILSPTYEARPNDATVENIELSIKMLLNKTN